jgi:hypothetical protein
MAALPPPAAPAVAAQAGPGLAAPVLGEDFSFLEASAQAVLTPVRFDRLDPSLEELMRRAPRELLSAATDVYGPQATEEQQRDNIFAATRAIAAIIRPSPKQPPKRKADTLSLSAHSGCQWQAGRPGKERCRLRGGKNSSAPTSTAT